jgi:ketosteroid isomerase-like protein
MRQVLLAFTLAVSTGVHPAASQDPAVMATVNQFVSSFNQGDTKAAAAACADQTSIIDEFPPYAWDGAGACMRWMADYDADARKNGITDGAVTLGAPRHVDIAGDRAYVVVPTDYEYKRNGQPAKETGSMLTVALQKSAAGWRITAWSWAKN